MIAARRGIQIVLDIENIYAIVDKIQTKYSQTELIEVAVHGVVVLMYFTSLTPTLINGYVVVVIRELQNPNKSAPCYY